MKTSQNGPNIWPGYVAAVAGLSINLLILIAVLAIGIFQIGAGIHEKITLGFHKIGADEKEVITESETIHSQSAAHTENKETNAINGDPMLNIKNSGLTELLPTMPQQASLVMTDHIGNHDITSSLTRGNNTHDKRKIVQNMSGKDDEADICFRFLINAYELSEESKAKSQTLIKSHLDGYNASIWATSPVSADTASRVAYIRVLAIRNYLIDSGFDRKNITVRLLSSSQPDSIYNEVNVKFVKLIDTSAVDVSEAL